MTNERTATERILSALPWHNDYLFNPKKHTECIKNVADNFTHAEIAEAIKSSEAYRERIPYGEFGDDRSRHITGSNIKNMRLALALKG